MDCNKLINQAIKSQNNFMVNLLITNQVCIPRDTILIALGICDTHTLKRISTHLNEYKNNYPKFYLQSQELNLICEMDNSTLIEDFKFFIDGETALCVMGYTLKQKKGINCLKKLLELKKFTHHHLYFLFKIVLESAFQPAIDLISKFSTKRMVNYAVSEDNSIGLKLILTHLHLTLSVYEFDKCIRFNLRKYPNSTKCVKIINDHIFGIVKNRCIRL
ncbi:hypothetical protein WIV_gp091 [Wiseana iridescent virus]|uniref:Uncharacterized protein n=1 Tax=Wiseana iridescent virus TaxID=68347 RepID=G0T5B7_IRV9|nr:hypothetical protein WIV_gp091 [Wiseana iridescent virus]ADO00435.1 hypothetical protein [Wiseana iridescent virus]